jgi:hypothetical protein
MEALPLAPPPDGAADVGGDAERGDFESALLHAVTETASTIVINGKNLRTVILHTVAFTQSVAIDDGIQPHFGWCRCGGKCNATRDTISEIDNPHWSCASALWNAAKPSSANSADAVGVGRFAIQLAHLGGAEVTALVSGNSARAAGLRELGANEVVSDIAQLRGPFDLILESVGGDMLGRLVTMVEPQGTLVMFGNSSNDLTTINVRDIYLDALIRLQGFELFFGGDPFGRDFSYLVTLVAGRKLDPQLASELSWEEMPEALERLRNRDAAGKVTLTLGA